MAPPSIVAGHTIKVDAANALTRTIAVPTHSSGDMIVLAVVSDSATGTVSSPQFADYAYQDKRINNATPVAQATASVMWRAAGGSEGANYDIDTSVTERVAAICFAISGADTSALHYIATEITNVTSATATVPAVITSVIDTLRISIVGTDGGITTTAAAADHTLIDQQSGTSAGGVMVCWKTVPTASTDPSKTAPLSVSEQWIGLSFVVAPTAGGTTYNQAVSGTIGVSGTLTKRTNKVLAGAVGASGSLRKTVNKILSGAITPSGTLGKTTQRALAGTVGIAGTLGSTLQHIYNVAIGGAIGVAGSLLKTTQKVLVGNITPSGTVSKITSRILSGSISITGSLLGAIQRLARLIPPQKKGTIYSQDNLSYTFSAPVWTGSNWSQDYTQEVINYDHSILAVGGFWDAKVTLHIPLLEVDKWLQNGLGRSLTVKGKAATTVWEGIVNQITVSLGGYRVSVGPYLEINNSIRLVYTSNLTLGSDTVSLRTVTTALDDIVSQAKYGILQGVYSAGNLESGSVTPLQQSLLNRYASPPQSEDLTLPGDVLKTMLDVDIECIGFIHLLQKYQYAEAAVGADDLSTVLEAVIDANPNALFLKSITSNTLQVPTYSADDTEAWSLIKKLVLLGDSSYNRYLFGVYEDRRIVYAPVTDEVFYIRPLREGASTIQDARGSLVSPWRIRPGKYIQIADYVPGKPLGTDLNKDLNVLFAETVQFRAPNSVIINGSHHFKIERRLAQLGTGGIS